MDRTFITFTGKFGVIASRLERPSLSGLAETAPHTQLKLPGLGRAGHRPHRQEPCWYCGPGALHLAPLSACPPCSSGFQH